MLTQTIENGILTTLLSQLGFSSPKSIECQSPEEFEETRRAEKEVFNDMMWSNSEVFSSELHVQYMMYASHGRR